MGKVKEISDNIFDKEVIDEKGRAVFVDFWAPWCGPCRMIAPIVEELADEMNDEIKFTKMNVDDSPVVASRYGISSIPSLYLFQKGEPIAKIVGAMGKADLKSRLEDALKGG